jgi:hypothetical protein
MAIINPNPAVGLLVLYIDHTEMLSALEKAETPVFFPAIIVGVRNATTQRLDLAVFDPVRGYQVKTDVVPYSQGPGTPRAGWKWPPPLSYPLP